MYLINKLFEDIEPLNLHEQIASLGLCVVLHLGWYNLHHQVDQLFLSRDVRHFLKNYYQLVSKAIF